MSLFQDKDKFLRQAARQALWLPAAATQTVNLGRPEIERLIPHRAPFLLVDAITAVDYEQQALAGVRRINPDDPVFAGHFPGNPILPGVVLLDAMLQAIAAATGIALDACEIGAVKFLSPAGPGDELEIRHSPSAGGAIAFEVMAGGRRIASGSVNPGTPR